MKKFFSHKIAIGLLLLAGCISLAADKDQSLQRPSLSAEYAKWRAHVLPSAAEQTARRIAWRASVLHGLLDAQKADKPVMIFLMNGHPLGCT